MKRDPSIHVTESQLALALGNVIELEGVDTNKLAKMLVNQLKTKTLINRSIIITNDKLEKKAKKLLSSSRGDADLLANIIFNTRMKLKHRGVKQIKPNTREWNTLKELTGLVIDFCNEFNLPKREGFIIFINIAIVKLNSITNFLNKLINMYEGIVNYYAAKLEIDQDDAPNITKAVHDMYTVQIINRTGLPSDYKDNPEKYVNFLKVRKKAKEIGITYEIYLKAQFHGFAWRNGVPDPIQLVAPQAMERLNKYMFENGIKAGAIVGDKKSTIDKLNALKKKHEEENG
jgi:hypothetical protein